MNRKIIFFVIITTLCLGTVFGITLDRFMLSKTSDIVISSENLSGYTDSFGSTVAIYVEQTEGQGDYIQKNNVPDDGSVYTVNSATHCIGGGI